MSCEELGCPRKKNKNHLCLGARLVDAEARYIGNEDVTPVETKDRALAKLEASVAAFGPVCIEPTVFKKVVLEVREKIASFWH